MQPIIDARKLDLTRCLDRRLYLEAIFDSLSEGVVVVDSDLRITLANRVAQEIAGLSAEEMAGRPCSAVLRDRGARLEHCLVETRQTGEEVRELELEIGGGDGEERPVVLTTSVLGDLQGEPVGVVLILRDVTELRRLREEARGRYGFHNLIGKSHRMREVYRLIEQAAASNATVLIEGESGTGKELVARAIHYSGPRSQGPFVAVNCSVLPETLLESELFGHVKGAFTGAVRDRKGRFEAADRGTLFLDEVGEMSPLIQLKLLRVLQEREFERVGESRPRRVDIRIIAATNQGLQGLVQASRFRQDFYYRLRVVPIELPPLRERREDIPLLARHFVEKFRVETGKPIAGLSDEALAALLDHSWPGNVRELENAIEHAFVRCPSGLIASGDLPPEIRSRKERPSWTLDRRKKAQAGRPEEERELLLQALREAGGNRSRAAQMLGIGRTTLYQRLREQGLLSSHEGSGRTSPDS